jgi:hypothetical protein
MLLVDRSASARVVEPRELHEWGALRRVFVSSVIAGMTDERAAAAEAISGVGATPVMFERFGGRDDDPERAYLSEVATSDIYVGLLGQSYGRLLPSRRSATHEEYREAERCGVRVSVWASSQQDWNGDQQDFLHEIQTFHVTGTYRNPAELGKGLSHRLMQIAGEELSPWAKLGESFDEGIAFRCVEVIDRGKRVDLRAQIKDEAVIAAFEAMRPGLLSARRARLTWGGLSTGVWVRSVITTRRTNVGATVVAEFDRENGSSTEPLTQMTYRMATGNYGPQDINERALRHVLFGDAHPFGTAMSFLAKLDNPIAAVASLGLSEEILRPILRLLFVEVLVGSGRASRVSQLRLGAPIRGQRLLEIAWTGADHRGSEPDARTVTGTVALT